MNEDRSNTEYEDECYQEGYSEGESDGYSYGQEDTNEKWDKKVDELRKRLNNVELTIKCDIEKDKDISQEHLGLFMEIGYQIKDLLMAHVDDIFGKKKGDE